MAGIPRTFLWVVTIAASILVPLTMLIIISFALPLSAFEALNERSKGAELGFWVLLLAALPSWLIALWLTALASEGVLRKGRYVRHMIWFAALALTLLAFGAVKNILGLGDLFSHV